MTEIDGGNGALVKKDRALAGAAVSATAAAVFYGLRKALAERNDGRTLRDLADSVQQERGEHGRTLVAAVWESTSDSVLPLAEEAAETAGKWVAKNAPALIRDRLLPRFIDSFESAR